MPTGTAIFTDTSILIARLLREPEMKKAIEERLASYDITVSSPIVIQEFKRRVINEAIYLMNQLNAKESYERVKRHVINVLPEQWRRKQRICLNMLEEIFESANDGELTDRAKRYLRTLIKFGVPRLRKSLGHIVHGTGCYLSSYPVREKKAYKRYDLVKKRCSSVSNLCNVAEFLKENIGLCKKIFEKLSELPEKTKELENACEFLKRFIENPDIVHQLDPCLSVGDLLIAIESQIIPDFYTMNYKESKIFCSILSQKLIVRPNNPNTPDTINSN